jgi:cytochrome c553
MTPRQIAAFLGTTLILAPAGCKTEPPKAQPAASAPAAAPTPAVPAAAPQPEAAIDLKADRHQHMKAHFVRALKLQDAILAGKLDDAKEHGRWLATHDRGDAPQSWQPYLATFQSEAKVVVDAASVDDAAVAVAHIAAACGDCHAANHASPKIGSAPLFRNAHSVKQHMAAQLTALDDLWNGLVLPSDQAWRDGAALLSKVVVTPKALAKAGLAKADSAKLLAETLHHLSATAGTAAKEDRPRAYAELLTTCVACHTTLHAPVVTTQIAKDL